MKKTLKNVKYALVKLHWIFLKAICIFELYKLYSGSLHFILAAITIIFFKFI